MSHDTDKLIRQLSLVAFLMAERRPLTARDVKSNVEGYSEMSDEAFARRFYSDRAELLALGVPLQSQRDEFTGEELYTLRSENYFLDKLELDDDELAALQTALYLLEGKFAYAEPLRLALQNLAVGLRRAGLRHGRPRGGARPRLLAGDAGSARQARGSDLETADDQVPLLLDLAQPAGRAHRQSLRTALRQRQLVRDRPGSGPQGHPNVPRLPDPRRHPFRDSPRTRLPHSQGLRHRRLPRPAAVADRRPARGSAHRARRRHRLVGGACLRQRRPARGRRLRHRVLVPRPARLVDSAAGRTRDPPRAGRAPPRGRPDPALRPRSPRGRSS